MRSLISSLLIASLVFWTSACDDDESPPDDNPPAQGGTAGGSMAGGSMGGEPADQSGGNPGGSDDDGGQLATACVEVTERVMSCGYDDEGCPEWVGEDAPSPDEIEAAVSEIWCADESSLALKLHIGTCEDFLGDAGRLNAEFEALCFGEDG